MVRAGNSKLQVACVRFKSVVFWDPSSDEELPDAPANAHNAPISKLVANAASSHALSMGTDGEILLWDLQSRVKSAEFPIKLAGMRHLALSHAAEHLAASDPSGMVVVHDISSGKLLFRWKLPQPARSLGFAKDGTVFATDSAGTVIALKPGNPTMSEYLRLASQSAIVCQASGPNAEFTALGLSGGVVAILNHPRRTTKVVEIPDCETISTIAFSRSGRGIAVTSRDNPQVWVIDVDSARLETTVRSNGE